MARLVLTKGTVDGARIETPHFPLQFAGKVELAVIKPSKRFSSTLPVSQVSVRMANLTWDLLRKEVNSNRLWAANILTTLAVTMEMVSHELVDGFSEVPKAGSMSAKRRTHKRDLEKKEEL